MNLAGVDRLAVLQHETRAISQSVAQRLRGADAPPFIGQILLSTEEKAAAVARLCQFNNPFRALTRLLKHQPHLALALIAGEVAGDAATNSDDYKVFPRVEALLGAAKQKLSNEEREELVLAFRGAAVQLGLTVQPERRPGDLQWRVNELVLQAGARRGHARALADAFLRTERAVGLPDPGDTAVCVAFCREAAGRLQNTPRLQMILEHDQTGWHASLFARLRLSLPTGESRIGPALEAEVSAHAEQPADLPRRRPQVVLRGCDVCIHVPEGELAVVDVGGRETLAHGGDIVIPAPWPASARWRPNGTDETWREVSGWSAITRGCAAFEAESGRLLGVLAPGTRLEVPPGGVTLVAARPFSVDGSAADVLLGGIHFTALSVDRSPASVGFGLEGAATIASRLDRRIALGPELGRDLGGAALLGIPTTASVAIPGEAGAGLAAQVWLRHAALPPGGTRIDVQLGEEGHAVVDLRGILPKTGPAGRLQVSLTLAGEERALVSASALYWPGLERFDGRRFYGPPPTNLRKDECRGIHEDDDGLCIAGDLDRPDVLLSVGQHRLRFVAPGVYASVERPGGPPGTAVPLPPGTTVVLGGNLASTLRLACDCPGAVLEVGPHVEQGAFARTQVRRISFASLLQAADAGDAEVRVRYLGPSDPPRAICRVSRAETPARFALRRRTEATEAEFTLHAPLRSVRISARELFEGSTRSVELLSFENGWAVTDDPCSVRLQRCSAPAGPPMHKLVFEAEAWGGGLWLADLDCTLGELGSYRPLRAADGALFPVAIYAPGSLRLGSEADIEGAFARLAEALGAPIAASAQATELVLAGAYAAVGRRIAISKPGRAARAFAADLSGHLSGATNPGFISPRSPWDIDLKAFAQPASTLDALDFEAPGLAAFRGLALVGRGQMLRDALRDKCFDVGLMMGFGNLVKANRAAALDLIDFSFGRYLAALAAAQETLLDEDPPLLGAAFMRAAEAEAAARLAEAETCTMNGDRLGRLFFAASRARQAAAVLARDAAALAEDARSFAPAVPCIRGWRREAGGQQIPDDLVCLISALALASRIEVRQPGAVASLRDSLANAIEGSGTSPEAAFGAATRIGFSLFAAHLLLWEILIRQTEP